MPIETAGSALAAKYLTTFAGFVGAVLSLTFLKGLTRAQAISAVAIGFSCSVFTTPLTIAYFSLPADSASEYGVAFLIGLLAMNIVPAIRQALNVLGERGFK